MPRFRVQVLVVHRPDHRCCSAPKTAERGGLVAADLAWGGFCGVRRAALGEGNKGAMVLVAGSSLRGGIVLAPFLVHGPNHHCCDALKTAEGGGLVGADLAWGSSVGDKFCPASVCKFL